MTWHRLQKKIGPRPPGGHHPQRSFASGVHHFQVSDATTMMRQEVTSGSETKLATLAAEVTEAYLNTPWQVDRGKHQHRVLPCVCINFPTPSSNLLLCKVVDLQSINLVKRKTLRATSRTSVILPTTRSPISGLYLHVSTQQRGGELHSKDV